MKIYSTRQAAEKLGISFTSMNRYIAEKKIPVPELTQVGSISARVWSEADIERVRALLPKIANGRKTRHQKQGKTQTKRKSKP